jgi:hypothetical protein
MAMTNFGTNDPLAVTSEPEQLAPRSSRPPLQRTAGRTVTNRFETFRCQACGRGVKRKSRHKDFALIAVVTLPQGSGQPTYPFFLSSKVNGLQGQKSESSIPLNVLGGYRWPNAVGVDRELLRKIARAEVGDTR